MEIEDCERESHNISLNVVYTAYTLPYLSYLLYLSDVRQLYERYNWIIQAKQVQYKLQV